MVNQRDLSLKIKKAMPSGMIEENKGISDVVKMATSNRIV